MTESNGDIEFAATRFPKHARTIGQLSRDEDFRELCEHLALMCRLELESDEETETRFRDLRQNLESELLEWVGRKPNTYR